MAGNVVLHSLMPCALVPTRPDHTRPGGVHTWHTVRVLRVDLYVARLDQEDLAAGRLDVLEDPLAH